MKCLQRIVIMSWIIGIIAVNECYAQTLRIDGMRALSSDLSASVYPRNDYNGRACALVKVAFPKTDAEFEGNIIGKTEYKAGEYWVYLTADSRYLKMKHAEYTPLMIRFDDSTVGAVESKIVYGVRVSAGTRSQLVTFKITPSNAILTVDNKEYTTSNGITEIMLTPGEHSYMVVAPGYDVQGSKFMVYENSANKIIIELEQKTNINSHTGVSSSTTVSPNNNRNLIYSSEEKIFTCDGIYRQDEVTSGIRRLDGFDTNLGKLNRKHFAIRFDFYPDKDIHKGTIDEHGFKRENNYVLVLSSGYRILGVFLSEDGIIEITTNNQRNRYKTPVKYKLDDWNTINLEYNNGTLTLNGHVIENVSINPYDGDNYLSDTNYSNGITFKGRLAGIKVYSFN